MRRFTPLMIGCALFALGLAACGGGSGPVPVYPVPGQGTVGQTLTMSPVSGYSGTLALTGTDEKDTGAAALVTATLSTSAPSGVGTLSRTKAQSSDVAPNPLVYISLTAGQGGAVIKTVSNVQIVLPSPAPSGQSVYLAYWNGTQWATLGSTGTLASGTTSTYVLKGGPINPPMTLDANAAMVLAIYEGTYAYPSPVPTATPTPTPTGLPTPTPTPQNVIVNGNFASGSLQPGWTACSYPHPPFDAPVNASPAPQATAGQTGTPPPIPQPSIDALATVQAPAPNYNPNVTLTPPPDLGSHVVLTGDPQAQTAGAAGICQTLTVPSSATSLSFWVYEGGTQYNFKYADQEADILDSTGTTVKATLFSELNCFWYPGVLGATGYTNSGCIPTQFGGTSTYVDWQGGFWTKRGPYDLTPFVGQNVTLFIGVWDLYTDQPAPQTYGNFMFVGNVQLVGGSGSAPVPVTIQLAGGHR